MDQFCYAAVTVYVWTEKERKAHIRLPSLSSERLWHLCWSEVLLLYTSPSFITPYSNGIFPSVFRRIQRLHNSLFWRLDSSVRANMRLSLCVCANLCGPSLSRVGPRMQASLSQCECLCFKLTSQHTRARSHSPTYKGLSVGVWKCITVSSPRTWRDRCERLVAAPGIGG